MGVPMGVSHGSKEFPCNVLLGCRWVVYDCLWGAHIYIYIYIYIYSTYIYLYYIYIYTYTNSCRPDQGFPPGRGPFLCWNRSPQGRIDATREDFFIVLPPTLGGCRNFKSWLWSTLLCVEHTAVERLAIVDLINGFGLEILCFD